MPAAQLMCTRTPAALAAQKAAHKAFKTSFSCQCDVHADSRASIDLQASASLKSGPCDTLDAAQHPAEAMIQVSQHTKHGSNREYTDFSCVRTAPCAWARWPHDPHVGSLTFKGVL
jgi:hypothetical protein